MPGYVFQIFDVVLLIHDMWSLLSLRIMVSQSRHRIITQQKIGFNTQWNESAVGGCSWDLRLSGNFLSKSLIC